MAAEAIGASRARIIARHVVPNCMSPVIIQATLDVGRAILEAAALSFLGFGAQPPTPEWGILVSEGRSYLRTAWWLATFPGLAIMITAMGFNFLGDGVRDFFDPKRARKHRKSR